MADIRLLIQTFKANDLSNLKRNYSFDLGNLSLYDLKQIASYVGINGRYKKGDLIDEIYRIVNSPDFEVVSDKSDTILPVQPAVIATDPQKAVDLSRVDDCIGAVLNFHTNLEYYDKKLQTYLAEGRRPDDPLVVSTRNIISFLQKELQRLL